MKHGVLKRILLNALKTSGTEKILRVSCIERRINADERAVISDTLLTKQLYYFGHAKWRNIRDETSDDGKHVYI